VAERRAEQPQRVSEAAEPPRPARRDPRDEDLFRSLGETPAFDSLNDPLSGPLREPLLAPLLDPTIREDDPLGVAGKTPAPGDDEREPARADDWSSEWLSGSWAMAPSALADEPGRRKDKPQAASDAPPERHPRPRGQDERAARSDEPPSREPRPAPRRPARHRYADEPVADGRGTTEPAAEPSPEPETRPAPRPEPPAQARPAPAPQPDADAADLGLRPESLARLSDADRELLARLQAELQGGPAPRVVRRAGVANGSGPNGSNGNGSGVNGNPRMDPPDRSG
jgi:hypothetical protein